jgi:hypothetical protein
VVPVSRVELLSSSNVVITSTLTNRGKFGFTVYHRWYRLHPHRLPRHRWYRASDTADGEDNDSNGIQTGGGGTAGLAHHPHRWW